MVVNLGPNNPEWCALRHELDELLRETGAHHICVLDAWSNLWCASPTIEPAREEEAIFVTAGVLKDLTKPLQRGGRVDRELRPRQEGYGYIRSYAGVYILLVRSRGYEARSVAWPSTVAAVLPRVETLTLALPFPDGPGSGSAEGFGIA